MPKYELQSKNVEQLVEFSETCQHVNNSSSSQSSRIDKLRRNSLDWWYSENSKSDSKVL